MGTIRALPVASQLRATKTSSGRDPDLLVSRCDGWFWQRSDLRGVVGANRTVVGRSDAVRMLPCAAVPVPNWVYGEGKVRTIVATRVRLRLGAQGLAMRASSGMTDLREDEVSNPTRRSAADDVERYPLGLAVFTMDANHSGVSIWVDRVTNGLRDREHDVRVLHPEHLQELGSAALKPSQGRRCRDSRLASFLGAWLFARKEGVDIVHCTSAVLPVLLGLRLGGARVVLSLHVVPRGAKGKFVAILACAICRHTVCVSRYLAKRLNHWTRGWFRNRISVVYNSVDAPASVVVRRADNVRLVLASRLAAGKGLEDIGLWARRLVDGTGWEVDIYGDGPLQPIIRELVAGGQTGIRWLGEVHDVEAIYRNATVVIVTSQEETFCRPAIEATIRGIPVLSRYRLPVLKELLGDFVRYSDDGSVGSLVEAAQEMNRAPETLPDPRELHEHAWPYFLGERQLDELEALYRAVAAGERRSTA